MVSIKKKKKNHVYLGDATLWEHIMNYLDVIVAKVLNLKSEHLTLIFCPTTVIFLS